MLLTQGSAVRLERLAGQRLGLGELALLVIAIAPG